MSNIIFQTLDANGGLKRRQSEQLAVDFLSLAIGPDKMALVQGGSGASAFWDFGTRSLRTSHAALHAHDVVNKETMDANTAGLVLKDPVRVATVEALPSYTASGANDTKELIATANGALTVDGVAVNTGDRILVKDEEAGESVHNGIYEVMQPGDSETPFILKRAYDFDGMPSYEVRAGAFTFVEEGTANSDAGFVLSTNGTIVVDTTAMRFVQFSGAGQLVAGIAIQKVGNTINVLIDNTTLELNGSNTIRVKDSGITTAKIADSNVTTEKIADQNVTTAKLLDSGVTTDKIANQNVTTGKIADAGVTTAKIADQNVTTAKIADQNVTTGKIADLGVTTAKIDDLAVTTGKIADASVTTAKIADANITKEKIAASAIGNGLTGGSGTIISVVAADGIKVTSSGVAVDYALQKVNDNAAELTSGKIVFIKPNGNVDLASKVNASHDTILGIVSENIAASATGPVILKPGAKINGFVGLIPGREYLINENGDMGLYENITFAEGEYVHAIGKAFSTTELLYHPEFHYEF